MGESIPPRDLLLEGRGDTKAKQRLENLTPICSPAGGVCALNGSRKS